MVDIKYVIRMEVIDVHIDHPFYNTTHFDVYDTPGDAIKDYDEQIKNLKEWYVDSPRPHRESIAIMSLYTAEVTEGCHPDLNKYTLVDLIHHTIVQYDSVKSFWVTRQCEDNDDWEDCK